MTFQYAPCHTHMRFFANMSSLADAVTLFTSSRGFEPWLAPREGRSTSSEICVEADRRSRCFVPAVMRSLRRTDDPPANTSLSSSLNNAVDMHAGDRTTVADLKVLWMRSASSRARNLGLRTPRIGQPHVVLPSICAAVHISYFAMAAAFAHRWQVQYLRASRRPPTAVAQPRQVLYLRTQGSPPSMCT